LAGILQSLQGLERDSTRSPFAKMQARVGFWRKRHRKSRAVESAGGLGRINSSLLFLR
jgi:hypothetical protein